MSKNMKIVTLRKIILYVITFLFIIFTFEIILRELGINILHSTWYDQNLGVISVILWCALFICMKPNINKKYVYLKNIISIIFIAISLFFIFSKLI